MVVLGIAAIQDVLEVFFQESELRVKPEISLEDILLESRHTVLCWVLFFWRIRPYLENFITLVFSGFSLILQLAHHIAKLRSCCKILLQSTRLS